MGGVSEDSRRASLPRWSTLALAYAVCAFILFLFAPLGVRETSTRSGETTQHLSLLQTDGAAIVVILALPVAAALVPVLLRRSPHLRGVTIASAVALTLMVIVGMTSFGFYYIPSAGLMIAAAATERPAPRRTASGFRDPVFGEGSNV
jgi:hypothetical protein